MSKDLSNSLTLNPLENIQTTYSKMKYNTMSTIKDKVTNLNIKEFNAYNY